MLLFLLPMGLISVSFLNKLNEQCDITQWTGLGKPKLGFCIQLALVSCCDVVFNLAGIVHTRTELVMTAGVSSSSGIWGYDPIFSPILAHKMPGEWDQGLTPIFLKDTSFTNNCPIDNNFNFLQRVPWWWLATSNFFLHLVKPILSSSFAERRQFWHSVRRC